MSLKIFHIIFITCSIFLLLSFCWWAWIQSFKQQGSGYCLMAIASFILAVGLSMYEYFFIKKMKTIDHG